MNRQEQIQALEKEWRENPRWSGITRPYSAEEVLKLRGKYKLDYTIATQMSELLWKKLNNQDFVAGLGALTGNQAVQEVDAGLEAIYLSVGKLPQTRIFLEKCILINRFILRIRFLRW